MDLPPVGQPRTKFGGYETELARTLFVLRGLLFRAKLELEGTPKPWPNKVKQARFILAQAKGIAHDAYEALPADLRSEATTTDKVVIDRPRRGGRSSK